MGIIADRSPCVQGIDPAVEFGLPASPRWDDPTDYSEPDVSSEADREWWAYASNAGEAAEWLDGLDTTPDWFDRYEAAVVDRYFRDRVSDYDQPWYRGR